MKKIILTTIFTFFFSFVFSQDYRIEEFQGKTYIYQGTKTLYTINFGEGLAYGTVTDENNNTLFRVTSSENGYEFVDNANINNVWTFTNEGGRSFMRNSNSLDLFETILTPSGSMLMSPDREVLSTSTNMPDGSISVSVNDNTSSVDNAVNLMKETTEQNLEYFNQRSLEYSNQRSNVQEEINISPIPSTQSIDPGFYVIPPTQSIDPGFYVIPPTQSIDPGFYVIPPTQSIDPGFYVIPPASSSQVNYDGLLESNQLLVDAQTDYNNALSKGIEQGFQGFTDVLDVYLAEAAIRSRQTLASFPIVNELWKYDFNKYKYIVLYNAGNRFVKSVKRNFYKKIKGKNYPIYVNTVEPFKTHDEYPEDLINNPDLGIYLSSWMEAPYMVNGYFQLYSSKGELLFSMAGEAMSFSSVAKSFLAYLAELKK